MMADMNPETLAAMSKAAGMDLSEEQAAKMTEQMKAIKPEQLAMIMKVASKAQTAYKHAVAARDWVRRNPAAAAAMALLLLALLVQWVQLRRARAALAAAGAHSGAGLGPHPSLGAAAALGGVGGAPVEEEDDPFALGAQQPTAF